MARTPWRKQLSKRGREERRGRAGAKSMSEQAAVASASPPTLRAQRVATAIASHSRLARSGSVILVCCHCHPLRLVRLNPPSIHVLREYQPRPEGVPGHVGVARRQICQDQPRIAIPGAPGGQERAA